MLHSWAVLLVDGIQPMINYAHASQKSVIILPPPLRIDSASARQHSSSATRSSVDTGSVYVRVHGPYTANTSDHTSHMHAFFPIILDDPGCPRSFPPYP